LPKEAKPAGANEKSVPGSIISTGRIDRLSSLMQEIRGEKDITAVADEIAAFGLPAVPHLVALLEKGTATERRNAMYVLGRMKSTPFDAVPVIEKILDEPGTDRLHIAIDLLRIDPGSVKAIDILNTEMKTGDVSDRVIIARVMSTLPDLTRCIPVLVGAMNDPDPEVRLAGIKTLGEWAAKNKVAGASMVHVFIRALSDSSSKVRCYAASSLGGLGEAAQSAVPSLSQMAQDGNPKVKQAAVKALELINAGQRQRSRRAASPGDLIRK